MLTLKDFMPEVVPAGWYLVKEVSVGTTTLVLYKRERDQLNVSMSWEPRADRPHLHMTFSKLRAQPTREEAVEAAGELLSGHWMKSFQMFGQVTNLHKFTVHARVYLAEAASA